MDYQSFTRSLKDPAPPPQATVALRALWYDANGETDSAERAASGDENNVTLRARAYLARKRGDVHEAQRWYWRSGATPWKGSFESEWKDLVHTVLVEFVVEQAYT